MQEQKELRLIVRIMNKDLDCNLPIYRALMKIKGLGHRMSRIMAYEFEKNCKIPYDQALGSIPEEMDEKLEEIVSNPEKFNIPSWLYNKKRLRDRQEHAPGNGR